MTIDRPPSNEASTLPRGGLPVGHPLQANRRRKGPNGKPRGWLRRHWGRIVLIALGAVFLFVGGVALYWSRDLPPFDTLKDYRPLITTRVFASDGNPVFQFSRERRTVVPFEEIPVVVRQAVLASEDAEFYRHEGVNYLAIGRCAWRSIVLGRRCGGSTITQQVLKTFLLSSEWWLRRKVKEIILAGRLEKNLSKDEILYLYLNQIYFGHRRYGIEEASQFYFGKSVRDTDLNEASILAGVIQSPERLSPAKHPARMEKRRAYVLRRMLEEQFITQEEAKAVAAQPVRVVNHPSDRPGAWYADAVRKYLNEQYGSGRVETDGLMVDIAMDPFMQQVAEKALRDNLRAIDRRQGWRGATHHLDPILVVSAFPLWRERLRATQAKPGEVLVLDLARVSDDDIEPGTEGNVDIRRMVRIRTLEAEETYNALVVEVTDKQATVDLGNATGTIALKDARWARKFKPSSYTKPPRTMKEVVKPYDIVLVRVMSEKRPPAELARKRKPLRLALEQIPKVQSALVAIDPATRGVRALVGGYDFSLSQFNRAIQARRQPGSAFKPFVWGAAIESRRYTPATVVYDTPDLYRDPWTGKEWKPKNYERDSYDGPMLLKTALAHSKNTISVKLIDTLGIDTITQFAQRAGITSEMPKSLSLALGTGEVLPIELVNAYTTIAAQGFFMPPVLVTRVRDRDGRVLEEHTTIEPPQPLLVPVDSDDPDDDRTEEDSTELVEAVEPSDHELDPEDPDLESAEDETPTTLDTATRIEPEVAFVLTSMMREVVENGTGAAARALGRPTAAKTGTAQENRDAWFVGFTPELVAGVWVGFDSNDPIGRSETGGRAALPAWLSFMQATVGHRPRVNFYPPGKVEFARIDLETGLLARETTYVDEKGVEHESPFVPFIAGTAPLEMTPDPDSGGTEPQSFFRDDE